MTGERRDVPEELLDEPSGEFPAPPVETTEQVLPFNGLRWDDFEKFTVRLALDEGDFVHVQRFGTRGQAQSGIDVYARQADGSHVAYQCKCVEELTPGDISGIVDDFLAGTWATSSTRFVLCTTKSGVRTERALAIEAAAKLLREHDPPIAFEVWDAESLSLRLKQRSDLVLDFFGPTWLDRFIPGASPASPERTADIEARLEATERLRGGVQLVTLDWATQSLREHLEQFSHEHPDSFARLTNQLGWPAGDALLAAAISQPPPWLVDEGPETWGVLARTAQSQGLWSEAEQAWVEKADRESDPAKADSLISAAMAANVLDEAGESYRRRIQQARDIDPEHPRLAIDAVDFEAPPAEQVAALSAIESDDPEVRLLLAGRLALASLLLPDVEKAKGYLAEASNHGAATTVVQAVSVNVVVQDGRLRRLAGEPLDSQALMQAHADALDLRRRLLDERRFSESARLLMLAADVLALLDDREGAARLLRAATDDERASPDGPVVLGDCAASRALDFHLALRFLEGAPDSPGVQRIRAECLEEVGTPEQRAAALETLEALIRADGPESSEAAFIILAASLGSRGVPWNEPAAEYLRSHGHERAAVSGEAFYRARHHGFDAAAQLLQPHLHEVWAKATLLRIAVTCNARHAIEPAADDLLGSGPAQAMRLEAGRAYAMCENYPRARETLLAVARDPSAPRTSRAEAYRLLLRVVGEQMNEWHLARTLLQEWTEVSPGDANASAWAPRVENRILRGRPTA